MLEVLDSIFLRPLMHLYSAAARGAPWRPGRGLGDWSPFSVAHQRRSLLPALSSRWSEPVARRHRSALPRTRSSRGKWPGLKLARSRPRAVLLRSTTVHRQHGYTPDLGRRAAGPRDLYRPSPRASPPCLPLPRRSSGGTSGRAASARHPRPGPARIGCSGWLPTSCRCPHDGRGSIASACS